MPIQVSDATKQDEEFNRLIEIGNNQLSDVLGSAERLVTRKWVAIKDAKNHSLVKLELEDYTGRVEGTFAPEEFQSPLHIGIRMHQLWGKLLSIQTKNILASIHDGGD